MGYSLRGLTLYAILSAIEEDLRSVILYNFDGIKDPLAVLGEDIYLHALDRRNKDQSLSESSATLKELTDYLDFGDAFAVINANNSDLTAADAKYFKAITQRLEKLVPIRNRIAHSRPLNFEDFPTTIDVAQSFVQENEIIWVELDRTLSRLKTEPSFVLGLEIPSDEFLASTVSNNLPIPDFDETGFIGRKQQVTDIIKLCLGTYPVITIVGEGGIGKTALALKVAYDIIDMTDSPFNAIVWTSSKSSLLTANEIIKIETAITSSLGMLQHVATYLSGVNIDNALDEVLNYLETFRILLIIDNLETVLDERIRTFLSKLPAGSKVLITSRIGLGAFEYPYKLQPMNEGEAIQLLRTLAKARGVEGLTRMHNIQLKNYCKRMQNNPLFIKWFVSAVQSGSRPEDILSNPDLLLEFCMSNVYSFLSVNSQMIIKAMLCVPGRKSQAELAFLTDLDALDIKVALQQLLTTNMVIMTSIPSGTTYETYYDLADLARAYLVKFHPVSPEESKKFVTLRRQLISASEQFKSEKVYNPFSMYSLDVHSQSDLIVAKYLLDALKSAESNQFDEAEQLVAKARHLAPEYFEVHRVDAMIKVKQDNFQAAREAYETAIDLQPNSAPLHFWYAGFLMRSLDDVEGALEHFTQADQIAPDQVVIRMEIARANLYLKNFDTSKSIVDGLFEIAKDKTRSAEMPVWEKRKLNDLYLQYFNRLSENTLAHHDFHGTMEVIQEMVNFYTSLHPSEIDQKMKQKIRRTLPIAKRCLGLLSNDTAQAKMEELIDWMEFETETMKRTGPPPFPGDVLSGRILHVLVDKSYGFIKTDSGYNLFFHRSNLKSKETWEKLRAGVRVNFLVEQAYHGLQAAEVELQQEN